jgi:FkbM family methyltransferase
MAAFTKDTTVNRMLDRALVAYSHLPHHPGKGLIYDRILARFGSMGDKPRRRARFGIQFECDLTDKLTRELYYVGFDRRDCRVLRQIVKPGYVILDIGANIGYFSLLFAKWMRGTGAVHAFEPFPCTRRRFERNLDLNPQLKSIVRLHELAMSDFEGSISMAVPDEGNPGCNHLNPKDPGTIKVTSVDAFARLERLSRLDFMKIDVEGSEVALLQGAEETINRFRPVLMIEINSSTLQRFGKTSADVVELLGGHRYRMSFANRIGTLRPLSRLPVYGEEPNIFAFPID